MAKPSGPTVARWMLGEILAKYRDEALMNQGEVAELLGCSIPKVQRIEYGTNSVSKSDLNVLLGQYKVTDTKEVARLHTLREEGKGRGWWVKYGRVPKAYADFLGAEIAASYIRIYEPIIVTGLLQTEDYARSIAEVSDGPIPRTEVERQLKMRMERQSRVFAEESPEIWMILDESVLHRCVGGPAVMAEQLQLLLDRVEAGGVNLQIMPFARGAHAGTRGALMIFEFPDDIHTPIGYVESNAGGIYLEDEDDQLQCNLRWQHLTAAAASIEESAKMITDAIKRYKASVKEQ